MFQQQKKNMMREMYFLQKLINSERDLKLQKPKRNRF